MVLADTIIGLVTPCDWDEKGTPLRVKICTKGEVDYFVADNPMGSELLLLVRTWVEVKGLILNFDDFKVIDVKEISKRKIGGSL